MPISILEKIKQANLLGRGGASFPVHSKWLRIKGAQVPNANKIVVCNAAEGEPGIRKDIYILENFLEMVFEGMRLAMDYLETKNAYLFIKEKSKAKIQTKLDEVLTKYNSQGYNVRVFIAPPKYVAGERNTLMSAIEGRILQPIIRQPSPGINGINGQPTLIQNVETFYNVVQVERGEYQNKRFATINRFDADGACTEVGVYEVDNDSPIKKILEETGNWPNAPFFVQIGGSISGVVLNTKQIETTTLTGSGGIDIIPAETKPRDLLLRWFKFFSSESCGKCAPCFKGSAELYKIVSENQEIPWERVLRLSCIAKRSSFCGLGESISIPVESLAQNIVFPDSKIENGVLVKKTDTTPAVTPTITTPTATSSPTTPPIASAATSPTTPASATVATTPKSKIRVGLFTFTCSEDSTIMLTILMDDYLLEWKKRIEFVEARILRKHKPDVPLDVAFVEGAITSEKQVPKLKAIRQRAKKLIAIGSCACTAIPAGLRNTFDNQAKEDIGCILKRFEYADKVRKIADVVPIDGMVPGCPMNTKFFLKLLNQVFVEYGFEPIPEKT